MSEIEEWFLREFGELGFSVGPLIYDPFTFAPYKKIMYNNQLTRLTITLNMINDSLGYDLIEDYKETLTISVERFLYKNGISTNFTPNRSITRFRFV